MSFKKIAVFVLTMALSLSLISCGQSNQTGTSTGISTTSSTKTDSANTSVSTTEATPSQDEDNSAAPKPKVVTEDGFYVIEDGDKDVEPVIFDEKVITIDELFSHIQKVELTPDNFFDYFRFEELVTEWEITNSSFTDEQRFKPHRSMVLLKNSDYNYVYGFQELTDIVVRFSYQITENYCNEYSLNDELLSSTPYSISSDPKTISAQFCLGRISSVLEYVKYYSETVYLSDYLETWRYSSSSQTMTQEVKSVTYPNVEKVEGCLYYWKEIPDDLWNVTPGGIRFISVQSDTSIVRLIENLGTPDNNNWFAVTYVCDSRMPLDEIIDVTAQSIASNYGESYEGLSTKDVLTKYHRNTQVIWPSSYKNMGFDPARVK